MRTVMMVGSAAYAPAGMLSASDWAAQGYKVIAKAFDGRCTWAEIQEKRPDIVITDIESSSFNGLELIGTCAGKKGAPAFVAMSPSGSPGPIHCALKLGAVDYLTKEELTRPQLLDCLERAESVCVQEGEKSYGFSAMDELIFQGYGDILRAYFQNLLSGGFLDAAIESSMARRLSIHTNFAYCTILAIDVLRSPEKTGSSLENRDIAEVSRATAAALRGCGFHFCLLKWGDEKLLAVLGAPEKFTSETVLPLAGQLAFELRNGLSTRCTVGVGRPVPIEKGLSSPLRQALGASEYYYYDSSSPVILYSDRCDVPLTACRSLDEYYDDLLKAFQSMDSVVLGGVFDRIAENLNNTMPSKVQTSSICVGLYYSIQNLCSDREILKSDVFPGDINVVESLNHMCRLKDYTEWLITLRDRICMAFEHKKDSRSSRQVSLVKDYVQEHYEEKLTLSGVAQIMNISRGYLSSVFKKETGMHFSDYIAQVKVEKAKELIEERKYLMYEISEKLGFENPYYFSKVFKKLTGHSPREYDLQSLSQNLVEEPIRFQRCKKAAEIAG